MSTSKMLYSFRKMLSKGDDDIHVRIPKPADVQFDAKLHFRPDLTESQYLNVMMKGVPYATFKTDDTDLMQNVMVNGIPHDGVVWMPFFPFWKDMAGHAFMSPKGSNIRSLADVGIYTHMSTTGDIMKVGKYVNRAFTAVLGPAYHGTDPVWGTEYDWDETEQVALILIDGFGDEEKRQLSIKCVTDKGLTKEQWSLADGSVLLSAKAVKALNLSDNPSIGDVWRATVLTPRGEGKGHFSYHPDLEYDIVIYGPKTVVRSERFFFASMGMPGMHVGSPHTDPQAFVNFGFHRPELAEDTTLKFLRELAKATKNNAEIRRMYLMHSGGLLPKPDAEEEEDTWISKRCAQYGIEGYPGVFRRVCQFLTQHALDFERARIPLDSLTYSVAKSAYVVQDPAVIGAFGDIHPERGIPAGYVIYPDLPNGTKVILTRQPSEHSNAWVALTVINRPEHKRFAGKGICMLGRDAHIVLGRLGGGDLDDMVLIWHDPVWVNAFMSLRKYPELPKVSDAELTDEDVMFGRDYSPVAQLEGELAGEFKDPDKARYTNRHMAWQIEMAKNSRAGIGPVTNAGMIDMLLSDPDHKASMLADLKARGLHDKYEWLQNRQPFQLAKLMSNLERVIDGAVKDVTLTYPLGNIAQQIMIFHQETQVYPWSLGGGDKGMRNRIPLWKRPKMGEEPSYVLAKSLTCKSLEKMIAMRDKLDEYLTQREWQLVRPANDMLLMDYPFERELNERLNGRWTYDINMVPPRSVRIDDGKESIRDIWRRSIKESQERGDSMDVAYPAACDAVKEELQYEDADMMERLSVRLFYQIYHKYGFKPRIDEKTKKLSHFSDGLLWSPVFGNHFINALRGNRGGLHNGTKYAGYYVPANVVGPYREILRHVNVMVRVHDGSVYIQDSEGEYTELVGFVMGLSINGVYTMDSHVIEYRKAQEICTITDDSLIMSQNPVTRIMTLKGKEYDTPKTKEPSGFGRWLAEVWQELKKVKK